MKSIEEYGALVAEAKARLITGVAKATKDDKKAVEVADAVLANELLAERSELDDQLKALKARKDAIDAILKDAIGSKDVLLVHGAKVASIARWRETAVNTEYVKEHFDVADYPEMFKRSNKSRLTVH
jgi:hypothetical protein